MMVVQQFIHIANVTHGVVAHTPELYATEQGFSRLCEYKYWMCPVRWTIQLICRLLPEVSLARLQLPVTPKRISKGK